MRPMGSRYGKKAYVNGLLIALNVLFFLYLEITGSSENVYFMYTKGAMSAPAVLEDGEYYRLLTAMFMHFGIRHIMNNMLVLSVLGERLEMALGHIKYLVFYILSGLLANIISACVQFQHIYKQADVSAGASGAIFGAAGGLIYAVAVNHGQLGGLTSRQLGFMVLLTLYHGFTSKGVDNAAHLGGLLAGFFLAAVMYRKPGRGRLGRR